MNIYSYNPSALAFKRSYITTSKENLDKFNQCSKTIITTDDDGNNKDVQISSEDPAYILALASQFNKYRIPNIVYHNFNETEKSNQNEKTDMLQELEKFERDNIEKNKVYEMAEIAREYQLETLPFSKQALFINGKYVVKVDDGGNIVNDNDDMSEEILYVEPPNSNPLDESASFCQQKIPHLLINTFANENSSLSQKENKIPQFEKNILEKAYDEMLFDIAETVLLPDLPVEEIDMDDEMGVNDDPDALYDTDFDEDDKDNFPDFTKWE
jgi:hypothetical protein